MSSPVRIALANGDGIGPEIMDATLSLFAAAGVDTHVEFLPVEMGKSVFDQGDTRGMTDEAIATVESCGLLFKGPMATPKGGGGKSINVTARKMWGAFANLRHFQSLPGVETVYTRAGVPVDFYVVRENVEDTYGGVENQLTADVIECKRLISAPGCDQVHEFAFDEAQRLGVKKLHCGHKANIMKMTDGMFLDRFKAAAKGHPEIETEDVIIDALCMGLVQRPQEFQMVVLPNLQGDIVSDLAAGLVGGLGFAPSANIGHEIGIFEAVHGTAPDIAGKGVANPSALILSGLMMLRHIGLAKQAAEIENALLVALESGSRTGDFGDPGLPRMSTTEFTQSVIDQLGQTPETTAPTPTEGSAEPTFEPPERPMHQVQLRTFTQVVAQVVGLDAYITGPASPIELAEHITRLAEGSPFKLTLISNRGTQVWPTGSVYTECVDYYRVRLELREEVVAGSFGQGPAIALFGRIAERYTVSCYHLLQTFDGERGYSLAQGQ